MQNARGKNHSICFAVAVVVFVSFLLSSLNSAVYIYKVIADWCISCSSFGNQFVDICLHRTNVWFSDLCSENSVCSAGWTLSRNSTHKKRLRWTCVVVLSAVVRSVYSTNGSKLVKSDNCRLPSPPVLISVHTFHVVDLFLYFFFHPLFPAVFHIDAFNPLISFIWHTFHAHYSRTTKTHTKRSTFASGLYFFSRIRKTRATYWAIDIVLFCFNCVECK